MGKKKKHINELDWDFWKFGSSAGELQVNDPVEYTRLVLKKFNVADWQKRVMLAFILGVEVEGISEAEMPSREKAKYWGTKRWRGWVPDFGKTYDNTTTIHTPSWMWREVYFRLKKPD